VSPPDYLFQSGSNSTRGKKRTGISLISFVCSSIVHNFLSLDG